MLAQLRSEISGMIQKDKMKAKNIPFKGQNGVVENKSYLHVQ